MFGYEQQKCSSIQPQHNTLQLNSLQWPRVTVNQYHAAGMLNNYIDSRQVSLPLLTICQGTETAPLTCS